MYLLNLYVEEVFIRPELSSPSPLVTNTDKNSTGTSPGFPYLDSLAPLDLRASIHTWPSSNLVLYRSCYNARIYILYLHMRKPPHLLYTLMLPVRSDPSLDTAESYPYYLSSAFDPYSDPADSLVYLPSTRTRLEEPISQWTLDTDWIPICYSGTSCLVFPNFCTLALQSHENRTFHYTSWFHRLGWPALRLPLATFRNSNKGFS